VEEEKSKNHYVHNGLEPGNMVIAKAFLVALDNHERRVYPEEIGKILHGGKKGDVKVLFEQGLDIWCNQESIRKLSIPQTVSIDFNFFLNLFHCKDKCVSSPRMICRIIKHLCYETGKVDNNLTCSQNIDGVEGAAINHFLELAVVLTLVMIAASSSPKDQRKVFIASHLAMKHLRDVFSRISSSDSTCNQQGNKSKQPNKYNKQRVNNVGVGVSSVNNIMNSMKKSGNQGNQKKGEVA
jgi:hypothetical protein